MVSRDEQVRRTKTWEQELYRGNPNYRQMMAIRAAILRVYAGTDWDNPSDVRRRSALVRLLNAKHGALYRKGMTA